MLVLIVLCASLIVPLQPVLARAGPPRGKYFKILGPLFECIQVEWFEGDHISLLFNCVTEVRTLGKVHVRETTPFHYEIDNSSTEAYDAFMREVRDDCPNYHFDDNDFFKYDYYWQTNTIQMSVEANPQILSPGECPW